MVVKGSDGGTLFLNCPWLETASGFADMIADLIYKFVLGIFQLIEKTVRLILKYTSKERKSRGFV